MAESISTHQMGDDPVAVEIWYPRFENNPDTVVVDLVDVRAANAIAIKYDFERDGWVILSNLYDPDQPEDHVDERIHEVAFVTAWPLKGVSNDS